MNKKYYYSRTYYFMTSLIIPIIISIIIFFAIDATRDYYKLFFTIIVFFVTPTIACAKSYLSRYVEFFDEYIHFDSWGVFEAKRIVTLNVRYENIYKIGVSKIPIFGIWKIKVYVKDLDYAIPIHICINKHLEVYKKICDNVRQFNPNVSIKSVY